MSGYLVFNRHDTETPILHCFVIDTAIEAAVKASKGTHKMRVWRNTSGKSSAYGGWGAWSGEEVEISVPNACVIMDTTGPTAYARGWAIGGKYYQVRDCKSCNNTGQDQDGESFCATCKGASLKPTM